MSSLVEVSDPFSFHNINSLFTCVRYGMVRRVCARASNDVVGRPLAAAAQDARTRYAHLATRNTSRRHTRTQTNTSHGRRSWAAMRSSAHDNVSTPVRSHLCVRTSSCMSAMHNHSSTPDPSHSTHGLSDADETARCRRRTALIARPNHRPRSVSQSVGQSVSQSLSDSTQTHNSHKSVSQFTVSATHAAIPEGKLAWCPDEQWR